MLRSLAAAALALAGSAAIATGMAVAAERWEAIPAPPAMPEPATSGMADVNGIRMYYAVYGEGEPVLLVHGGLGNADVWAHQVIDLAKDHRVIVADSRGHGRSTRNEEPFGYDLMAADYEALLDQLGIGPVTLVGWSDGGIIGLAMAMNHPEKLTTLVAHAANSSVDGILPTVHENPVFGRYIEDAGEWYRKLSPTPDQYDDFVAQISHMWESEPAWTAENLGTITVPTTIVLGSHDEAISMEHTAYLAGAIPKAKLVVLRDTSHFSMLQDPEEYNRMIRAALAD